MPNDERSSPRAARRLTVADVVRLLSGWFVSSVTLLLADAVHSRAWLIHAPSLLSLAASRAIGVLVRDIMLTRDEVTELTHSLLVSNQPPRGTISLGTWAADHAAVLGREYHSELDRHFR